MGQCTIYNASKDTNDITLAKKINTFFTVIIIMFFRTFFSIWNWVSYMHSRARKMRVLKDCIQLCNFVISVYTSAMVEMSNSIQTSMEETRQKYLQLFLHTRYQPLFDTQDLKSRKSVETSFPHLRSFKNCILGFWTAPRIFELHLRSWQRISDFRNACQVFRIISGTKFQIKILQIKFWNCFLRRDNESQVLKLYLKAWQWISSLETVS